MLMQCAVCQKPIERSAARVARYRYQTCSTTCRDRRNATLPRKPGPSREQRFFAKVNRTDSCWLWTGATIQNGYGKFGGPKGTISAHRFAYELLIGPIPAGLCVLHRCDVRLCVNPDHLFLGTQRDNSIDMVTKGRSGFQRDPTCRVRGEASPNAKLTNDAITQMRDAFSRGASKRRLAIRFGVSRPLVKLIVEHRLWKHVS